MKTSPREQEMARTRRGDWSGSSTGSYPVIREFESRPRPHRAAMRGIFFFLLPRPVVAAGRAKRDTGVAVALRLPKPSAGVRAPCIAPDPALCLVMCANLTTVSWAYQIGSRIVSCGLSCPTELGRYRRWHVTLRAVLPWCDRPHKTTRPPPLCTMRRDGGLFL